MNNYSITFLLVLNTFIFSQKSGINEKYVQNNRLFDRYPNAIHFKAKAINALAEEKKDENISITSSENLGFKGVVLQNITWNEGAQTIAIQLDSFPQETRFIINKITKNGKALYKAHILNLKYTDAYQLTGYGDTEFVFTKVSTQNIVTP